MCEVPFYRLKFRPSCSHLTNIYIYEVITILKNARMTNSLNVGYLGYAINVRRCPLIINYYPLNGIHIANRKFQETVGSRWSWTASGIGWFD